MAGDLGFNFGGEIGPVSTRGSKAEAPSELGRVVRAWVRPNPLKWGHHIFVDVPYEYDPPGFVGDPGFGPGAFLTGDEDDSGFFGGRRGSQLPWHGTPYIEPAPPPFPWWEYDDPRRIPMFDFPGGPDEFDYNPLPVTTGSEGDLRWRAPKPGVFPNRNFGEWEILLGARSTALAVAKECALLKELPDVQKCIQEESRKWRLGVLLDNPGSNIGAITQYSSDTGLPYHQIVVSEAEILKAVAESKYVNIATHILHEYLHLCGVKQHALIYILATLCMYGPVNLSTFYKRDWLNPNDPEVRAMFIPIIGEAPWQAIGPFKYNPCTGELYGVTTGTWHYRVPIGGKSNPLKSKYCEDWYK